MGFSFCLQTSGRVGILDSLACGHIRSCTSADFRFGSSSGLLIRGCRLPAKPPRNFFIAEAFNFRSFHTRRGK